MDLNLVGLTGRLTRDVEFKVSANGTPIAKFGLAINGYKEKVAFVDCTAFKKTAEIAQQFLRRGSRVGIKGELDYEQWTSIEGHKRSKLSVVAETITLMDRRGDRPEEQQDITGGNEPDHPF